MHLKINIVKNELLIFLCSNKARDLGGCQYMFFHGNLNILLLKSVILKLPWASQPAGRLDKTQVSGAHPESL